MKKSISIKSLNQKFWNKKYQNKEDKWDLGRPTPVFVNWSKKLKRKYNILIPGSGRGHDAIYLSNLGHSVTAVDISNQATNYLSKKVDSLNLKLEVINKNIFDLKEYYGNYDIVLEYTCFCAINPKYRQQYIYTMHKLLKDKGMFVGLLFPTNKVKNINGPPFLVDVEETTNTFSNYFRIVNLEKSNYSIKERANNEIFIEMIKNV